MSKVKRPNCIGMLSAEEECDLCEWREECERMSQSIESDAMRGGTHVRLTGKYKEKKYKPKKLP
jgi:hypothetical protein